MRWLWSSLTTPLTLCGAVSLVSTCLTRRHTWRRWRACWHRGGRCVGGFLGVALSWEAREERGVAVRVGEGRKEEMTRLLAPGGRFFWGGFR